MDEEKVYAQEARAWQPRDGKGGKGGKRNRMKAIQEQLPAPWILLTALVLTLWYAWDVSASWFNGFPSHLTEGVVNPMLAASMQHKAIAQLRYQEAEDLGRNRPLPIAALMKPTVSNVTTIEQLLPPPLTLDQAAENAGGEERRIILATATSNYLDPLNNWLESVETIGASSHVLLVAEDEEAYNALAPKMPNSTVKGYEVYEMAAIGAPKKGGAGVDHGPFFNSIVMRRPHYIRKLLDLNYSVLYTDVDVIFIKDPFEAFTGDFDVYVQDDREGSRGSPTLEPKLPSREADMNLCTCFMFVRPTQQSKWLIDRWMYTNQRAGVDRTKLEGMADQIVFNNVVKEAKDGSCRVGVLSQLVFPSGCIFFGCKPGIREPYVAQLNDTRWEDVALVIHNRPTAETAGAGQLAGQTGVTTSTAALPAREVVKLVAGQKNVVIIATATANYMDFVTNWIVSVEKAGYEDHILLIAEDELAFHSLHMKLPNHTVKGWELVEYDAGGGSVAGGGFFFSSFFNQVVMRRPNYILSLLKMGVDVLYSDVDIVMVKDPFPHFKGDYDIWVQDDSNWASPRFKGMWDPVGPAKVVGGDPYLPPKVFDYCTCFLYCKANPRSMVTIDRWRKQIEAQSAGAKTKSVKNQGAFNKVITNLTDADARISVLPRLLFPAGCTFFDCYEGVAQPYHNALNGTVWKDVAVIVHNNGVKFHQTKKERFVQHGLWYLDNRR